MTEYRIVTSDFPDELSAAVTKNLAEGWELHGGASCAYCVDSAPNEYGDFIHCYHYSQAMTRKPVISNVKPAPAAKK